MAEGTEIKKRLKTLRDKLKECIEPRYGLLITLVSSQVLSIDELEKIKSKGPDSFEQCAELLNIMQRKTPSECKMFLDALIANEQKHVAVYIIQDARRFESNHSDYNCWPLERMHRNRICWNLDQLTELIECKGSGLIEALYVRQCINRFQFESLMESSTDTEKNVKVLTMLLRRSIRDYNVFVELLKDSWEMSYLACLFERDVIVEQVDLTVAPASSSATKNYWMDPNTDLYAIKEGGFDGPPSERVDEQDKSVEELYKDIDNAQLLVTLSEPPTDSKGRPRPVQGVVMLEKFVYVIYKEYNKVKVFASEDCYDKVKDIKVDGMERPGDMVGSSVTSQLFITEGIYDVIVRVDLKTGVSDVFIELRHLSAGLSLVENRLLVISRDSLSLFDICSRDRERIKNIPFPEDWKEHGVLHAIESNRDSFFVCHRKSDSVYDNTVSEIDSEGRVIRVFNNEERLVFEYLALDSLGRLLVADYPSSVLLLDCQITDNIILIDSQRLENAVPSTLNYNKNSYRLAVGFENGQVKIFQFSRPPRPTGAPKGPVKKRGRLWRFTKCFAVHLFPT